MLIGSKNDEIVAFSDQATTCGECGTETLADTIADLDMGTSYWRCPECDAWNKERV